MAEVEHIIELSHRPNIHVSVVDLATPKPFLTPRGFHLYDDTTVEVATDVGTTFLESRDDLAVAVVKRFVPGARLLDGRVMRVPGLVRAGRWRESSRVGRAHAGVGGGTG